MEMTILEISVCLSAVILFVTTIQFREKMKHILDKHHKMYVEYTNMIRDLTKNDNERK